MDGTRIITSFILQLLPALPTLILASWALIAVDSSYFSGLPLRAILAAFAKGDLSLMAATPFNSLVYNLSISNLAEHGLHPRWLHVVANWPMLFGAGVWAVADVGWAALAREGRQWKGTEAFMARVHVAAFVLPTLALSVQPHQEPRFLLPLIVPVVALLPQAGPFRRGTSRARAQRRAVWAVWLAHSALFTVLFGYMHQGGLLPALFELNETLREDGLPGLVNPPGSDGAIELVFWRTFMPPRHLFLPATSEPRLSSLHCFVLRKADQVPPSPLRCPRKDRPYRLSSGSPTSPARPRIPSLPRSPRFARLSAPCCWSRPPTPSTLSSPCVMSSFGPAARVPSSLVK